MEGISGQPPAELCPPNPKDPPAYAAPAPLARGGHQLFALIIGINQYTAEPIHNLKGAVGDAQKIQEYIKSTFKVKDSNITLLLDADATRDNIIRNLKGLASHERIQRDDPVLIFFAGHGIEIKCPKGWEDGLEDDAKIQAILPCDYLQDTENGEKVDVIPDRTISVLLKQIADQKGNNITVIFDSCHSGSATRTYEIDPTWLIRGVSLDQLKPNLDVEQPIDPDLDRELWDIPWEDLGIRGARPADGYFYAGLNSHVLLAACGASELAREEQGTGQFTKALLQVLAGVGSEHLSYTDLITRLPDLTGQHPRCEGEHRKRTLFDAVAPIHEQKYDVRKQGDKYELQAGATHGITKGSIFEIYEKETNIHTEDPILKVVASTVMAMYTTLEVVERISPNSVPDDLCAFQVLAGQEECLRLVIKDNEELLEFCKTAIDRTRIDKSITIYPEDNEGAHLALHTTRVREDTRVEFENLWSSMYGLKHMPVDTPIRDMDKAIRILNAAARFFWNLKRNAEPRQIVSQNTELPAGAGDGATRTRRTLKDFVEIRLNELEESGDCDEIGVPVLRPKAEELIKENRIDLIVDSKKFYGVTIKSKAKIPLWVYLYYFDHSELSIVKYYEATTTNEPLQPWHTLAVGYGSGGARPFSYFLREGQDIDVGCLKLFVTNHRVDFSQVHQFSPFESNRGAKTTPLEVMPLWDTALIPLIQYRNEEIRQRFVSNLPAINIMEVD